MRTIRLTSPTTILVMVIIASGAVACVSPTPVASPTPIPTRALVAPTPLVGYAVITGFMLATGKNAPPVDATLYLGDVVNMDNGLPAVRLDRKTALWATPAQDGYFVFSKVPPGRYGLVIGSPEASLLLRSATDGQSLLLDLGAGQTVDVGRLEVPEE